jgi:chromosome segregation ATPase
VKLENTEKRFDRFEDRFDKLEDRLYKVETKVDSLDVKVTDINDYIRKMNGAVPHLQADVNSILALLSTEKSNPSLAKKSGDIVVSADVETKIEIAETKFKLKLLWGSAIFLLTSVATLVVKIVLGF